MKGGCGVLFKTRGGGGRSDEVPKVFGTVYVAVDVTLFVLLAARRTYCVFFV